MALQFHQMKGRGCLCDLLLVGRDEDLVCPVVIHLRLFVHELHKVQEHHLGDVIYVKLPLSQESLKSIQCPLICFPCGEILGEDVLLSPLKEIKTEMLSLQSLVDAYHQPINAPLLQVLYGVLVGDGSHPLDEFIRFLENVRILDVQGSCQVLLLTNEIGRESSDLTIEVDSDFDRICSILLLVVGNDNGFVGNHRISDFGQKYKLDKIWTKISVIECQRVTFYEMPFLHQLR